MHGVGGRAQHEDPPGPVLALREDLQVMKHESQVGGCSQSRDVKVERWEWFPLSGDRDREHAVFGKVWRSGCRGGSGRLTPGGFLAVS